MNATALDAEVWHMASLAADHQQLIEQSIMLASKQDLAAIDLASVERANVVTHAVDIEKQKAVYATLLDWCRKTKDERENLTYTQKRDFLDMLGMTVFVGKRPDRYHELDWDAKLRLPELEAVLHERVCISLS